jgi:glc operon protein GlcG
MQIHRTILAIAAMSLLLGAAAQAQVSDRKALSLAGVKNILAAAEAEARRNEWNVVIAVVDEGGHLLGLLRLDDTQTASVDIAIGKARTAAGFRRPSGAFEDAARERPAILSFSPDFVLLQGGLPIVVDGRVIGAVGVSGVRSDQDEQIAQAGIEALED